MSRPQTSATVVSTVDLAPDMPGYQLRLRRVVFEPGSVAGMHHHKERPAFSYIVEGTLTVGTQGGDVREYKAGEVVTESRDVIHWGENRGTRTVVIISVDIIKKASWVTMHAGRGGRLHGPSAHMAKTSFTSVGSSADSPARSLGLSPVIGHAAEILDGYDPYLGDDAEQFP
jgi:quercetin dioxygenase-like cupin family protein